MQVFTAEAERRIVKGLKDKKEEVFKEFYDLSRPFITNLLNKEFPNRLDSDIDDILQETYCKAWLKIDSFGSHSLLTTWLYNIAKNVVIDKIIRNKHTRVCDSLDLAIQCGQEFPIKHFSDDDKIVNKVAEIKNCLGKKHLAIFNLVYEQGLSFKLVAKKTRLPIGTVLSRSHYLKQKIKRELGV